MVKLAELDTTPLAGRLFTGGCGRVAVRFGVDSTTVVIGGITRREATSMTWSFADLVVELERLAGVEDLHTFRHTWLDREEWILVRELSYKICSTEAYWSLRNKLVEWVESL